MDTLADRYATENQLPKTVIKPDYKNRGKYAPLIRNTELVKLADKVICVYSADRIRKGGTGDTYKKATKAGKLAAELIPEKKPPHPTTAALLGHPSERSQTKHKNLKAFFQLTREGSEKGCWQASVTAEDGSLASGRNKRPQLGSDALAGTSKKVHAAMSRCKPQLSVGKKSHQAKTILIKWF